MTTVWSAQADALARASYLHDLAGLMWPAPATVTIGRPGDAQGHGPAEEYLIVPHARHPRLLVPARRREAAAAVAGFHPGRSRRARLLSHGLAVALRSGAGHPMLRDRLTVRGGTDTLRSHLASVLDRELAMAVHIGPARANRKPVAQLIGAAGGTIGYAKVGAGELTRQLVRAEDAALRLLEGTPLSAVKVPGVRHRGQWRGSEILVLDPLPTGHAARARPGLRSAAMLEIAAIGGLRRLPLGTSPYVRGLRQGLGALGERGAALTAILATLTARAGDTVLAFGAWHGDWTEWNMAPHGAVLLAWDWERFATGVPIGFDALHFHAQEAITARHQPPAQAVAGTFTAAAQIVQPLRIMGGHTYCGADWQRVARLTAALYFLEIARRYLDDRQAEAGAHLGRPADWLLPGLTEAVRAL